ncbi:MAG: carbon-nitrogen hydrolase family protein [Planctomycetes bacterium]|nr:carbon-nitrogen hydrolase family protein [Planctomycetota bacterium]
MKVTVCELNDQPDQLEKEWVQLIDHLKSNQSELVLLPEIPFYPWLAYMDQPDQKFWQGAVAAHDQWLKKLPDLNTPIILGTSAVIENNTNHNQGYLWTPEKGYQSVHNKYYLPNEKGFYEANWYRRGAKEFATAQSGPIKTVFLICTEIWFTEHARAYAKQGVNILAAPRATAMYSVDKWIAGGRAAAVMSGAYCLSSNRGGFDARGTEWGSNGWIIEPEEGQVLGITSPDQPFLTLDIDLKIAEYTKNTYPRYVLE